MQVPVEMAAKSTSDLFQWRLTAFALSTALLAVGFSVTAQLAGSARQLRLNTLYAQQIELATTTVRYMASEYIAPVALALRARHLVQSHLDALSTAHTQSARAVSPLQDLMEAVSTLCHGNITIGATVVLNETDRSLYEAWLTEECASSLNVSSVRLAPLGANGPRGAMPVVPPSPSGYYPVRVLVARSWPTPKAELCAQMGFDLAPSVMRLQAFFDAMESTRLIWSPPLNSTLLHMALPVTARSVAEAGASGQAHAGYLSAHPQVMRLCTRSSPFFNATLAGGVASCGHSPRALGVISIPVDMEANFAKKADTIPNLQRSKVTLLYIPPAQLHLLPLHPLSCSEEHRQLLQADAQPMEDSEYLDESFPAKTSCDLQHGALAPLLRALTPSRVILFTRFLGDGVGWTRLPLQEALSDAAAADDDMAKLQVAKMFVLGSAVFVLVVRDPMGVDTPEFLESLRWTWAFGGIFTLLLSLALPVLIYLLARQQTRKHDVQIAMVQSEKEGVVQAVAFAAHEIRNPMHGVLASLETSLEDLKPLLEMVHALRDIMQRKDASPSSASLDASMGAVVRSWLDSASAFEKAILALEDVAVAKHSAENCHRLVNDMVDYSKLQRGVMSIQNTDMHVRPALRALLESQRSFLHSSVRMFVGVHPTVPACVRTDQVRILQVLTNGLTNASKFTHSGAIYLSCTVMDTSDIPSMRMSHNPSNRWVAFMTVDTGKGLAGIDVDSLFEPIQAKGRMKSEPSACTRSSSPWPCMPRGRAAQVQPMQEAPPPRRDSTGPVMPDSGPVAHDGKSVTATVNSDKGAAAAPSTGITQAMSAASIAKSRGSGLGLPVARLMARAMGGDVDLYSQWHSALGKQATSFIFVLPASAVLSDGSGSLSGDQRVIPQYPLFGRTGRLPQAARQAVRARLCDSFIPMMKACVPDVVGEPFWGRFEELSTSHSTRTMSHANRGLSDNTPVVTIGAQPHGHSLHVLDLSSESESEGGRRCDSREASDTGGMRLVVQVPASALSAASLAKESDAGTEHAKTHAATKSSAFSDPLAVTSSSCGESLTTPSHTRTHTVTPQGGRKQVLRVLYAEDDSTNRRLMERMLGRLSLQAARQADGAPETTLAPVLQLRMAVDGWEALCALYAHGHISYDILCTARNDASSTEGELHLPPMFHEAAAVVTTDAATLVRGAPFDLVLLDIDMPRVTGEQVATYLRRAWHSSTTSSPLSPVPVPTVAVTGRCSNLQIWNSGYCVQHTLSTPGIAAGGSKNAGEGGQAKPADAALQAFDGALGKPFKLSHLSQLLDMVQRSGQQRMATA